MDKPVFHTGPFLFPAQCRKKLTTQFDGAINVHPEAFVRERGWYLPDRALLQGGEFAGDAAIAQIAYGQTWAAALPLYSQIQAGILTIR